ncbi:hypothetical protein OIU74_001626 [Salix koriyanagi]|uniref:Uncharacterized protein n=1 Tax=Salix koriyanagi TaxID=2511006 RepID=A0A9Q0X2G7_9ROSI|nr:hypothetical protein OIU74_001626 [Salix koriyanagi]
MDRTFWGRRVRVLRVWISLKKEQENLGDGGCDLGEEGYLEGDLNLLMLKIRKSAAKTASRAIRKLASKIASQPIRKSSAKTASCAKEISSAKTALRAK